MAFNAVHIASVAHDAALRRFEAMVDFFIPGIPQPLRIPVTVQAPVQVTYPALVHQLVARANRQIATPGIG